MESQDISKLAIKLMGLYFIVASFQIVPIFVFFWLQNRESYSVLMMNLSMFAFNLIFGILLIKFSKNISSFMFKENSDIECGFNLKDLQKIIFSCIAVYLTITSLADITNAVISVINGPFHWTTFQSCSGHLMKLSLGAFLFKRS